MAYSEKYLFSFRLSFITTLFWGLFLFLFLVSCQPGATAVLPTPAALAQLPEGLAGGGDVPATWTPLPMALAMIGSSAENAGTNSSLLPSRTPSITPILPTITPIPPSPTITPTPLPATPTGTPYAFSFLRLPPTDELGPSKLGLHVINNNDPRIMQFVRDAQPALVKGLGDLGFLSEVEEVSPRTVTVGRVMAVSQDYVGTPEEAARAFVNSQLAQYQSNPHIDYWEGWNEPDPNLDKMPWYARFEQERVRLMALYGFRAAIGSFATGVPELDEFELFVPAVETAKEYGGILALHEYGAPDMTFLYGSPLPGMPAYPDRGSLNFRYRWYYREILEPRNLVIPLAITEAGIDGVIGNRPGPSGLGWRDFTDYWATQGWGTDGEQAFINQLAWYDAGTRQDGYVIGFAIFTAGAVGHWTNYEIGQLLPRLAGYVISQR